MQNYAGELRGSAGSFLHLSFGMVRVGEDYNTGVGA